MDAAARGEIEFLVHEQPFMIPGIELRIANIKSLTSPRSIAIADPVVFVDHGPDSLGIIMPPALTLRLDEAKQLMDQLWRVGIRPSNGNGNVGQLEATVRHLEDMRRLVFSDGAAGVKT
jgi:hypothetical protein